jgi:hypothetical protein
VVGIAVRLTAGWGIAALSIGLVHAMDYDRAAGMMPSAPPHLRSDQQEIGHPVEGEVMRIDGEFYFVEDLSGNEIRLIVNESTVKTGSISQGERVEARINNENRALSIRPIRTSEADPTDTQSPTDDRK